MRNIETLEELMGEERVAPDFDVEAYDRRRTEEMTNDCKLQTCKAIAEGYLVISEGKYQLTEKGEAFKAKEFRYFLQRKGRDFRSIADFSGIRVGDEYDYFSRRWARGKVWRRAMKKLLEYLSSSEREALGLPTKSLTRTEQELLNSLRRYCLGVNGGTR